MDVNAQSSDPAARPHERAAPSLNTAGEPLPSTGLQPQTASEPPGSQDKTLSAEPGAARWPRPASGTIGPYQLLEEVAVGGMGVVYKARHTTLGRVVALKTMRPDIHGLHQAGERFDREMRAAARLAHPHIVPIYEVGHHEGRPYYAMAYVSGGSLVRRRDARGVPAAEAVALVEKVARAVHHAHEQGVLHRDLKPGNVLLDDQGQPHVSDFGLAKFQDGDVDLTETGAVLGTPAYMAPEQAAGRTEAVVPATDVWALGVILYELLTGQRPFRGDTSAEVKRRILGEDPPLPRSLRPDLSQDLEHVVRKCLRKEPADRYPSALALADDLARNLRGQVVEARPGPWHRRLRDTARRHPRRAALALCLMGALVAGVTLLPRSRPAPTSDPPITLIGERGAPQDIRWVTGEKQSEVLPAPDGFRIRSQKSAMLELLHSPPWDRYRLEAQIRHDARDNGDAGLWLYGWSAKAPHEGTYDSFVAVTLTDRGALRGSMTFSVGRLKDPAERSYTDMLLQREFYGRSFPAPEAAPWRSLGIDVTPEAIHLRYDGRRVQTYLPTDLATRTEQFFKAPANPRRFTPQGAVGIAVSYATATFRNVTLTPLPASDRPAP